MAGIPRGPYNIGDICNNIMYYTGSSGRDDNDAGNGKVAGILIRLDKAIQSSSGNEHHYILSTTDRVSSQNDISNPNTFVVKHLQLENVMGGRYKKTRRMRKTRSQRR